MKKFQFDDLDNIITNLCNGILGGIETKRKAKGILCKAVILSCKAYNSDENFKNKIDELSEFYNID